MLRARARDIIKQLGYTDQPADTADGFVLKEDYLRYIAAHDQSPSRWNRLRTEGIGPYRYWYRQSPRYFDTIDTISVDRPALDVSGMTSVYLDMEGRLHWFVGVPPQREPPEQKSAAPDWSIPFRQAGLDIAPSDRLLRLSVGIEAEVDLLADLDHALSRLDAKRGG